MSTAKPPRQIFQNRELPLDGPAVMENYYQLEEAIVQLGQTGSVDGDEGGGPPGGSYSYTAGDVTDSTVGPRFYPPQKTVISTAYICLDVDPSSTLTFVVKKNGTTVITGTSTTQRSNRATGSGKITVGHDDYLTVAITSAGGATGAGVVVIE